MSDILGFTIVGFIFAIVVVPLVIFSQKHQLEKYKQRVQDTLQKLKCSPIEITKIPKSHAIGFKTKSKILIGSDADGINRTPPTMFFKVTFKHENKEYHSQCKVVQTKEFFGKQLSVIFHPRISELIEK